MLGIIIFTISNYFDGSKELKSSDPLISVSLPPLSRGCAQYLVGSSSGSTSVLSMVAEGPIPNSKENLGNRREDKREENTVNLINLINQHNTSYSINKDKKEAVGLPAERGPDRFEAYGAGPLAAEREAPNAPIGEYPLLSSGETQYTREALLSIYNDIHIQLKETKGYLGEHINIKHIGIINTTVSGGAGRPRVATPLRRPKSHSAADNRCRQQERRRNKNRGYRAEDKIEKRREKNVQR